MMPRQSQQHNLLIGLPATGKTTYLAALWHVVQQLQPPSMLQLEKLDGETKYLNEICKTWLTCEPVPRTNPGSETVASMHLRDTANDRSTTLLFPDLSGESFELQWATRQLTKTYDKQLRTATGALIFVNPLTVVEPVRIDQLDAAIADIEQLAPTANHQNPTSFVPAAWSPDRTPTQVQLVELLQFLTGRSSFRKGFRLAVMISAWDRVSSAGLTPIRWLEQRLPLLAQFLEANTADFEAIIYGVSAQGGEYATDAAQLAVKNPIDRILLIGANVKRPQDLTEPIRWLMR
jgi:hypothetical protein